MSMEMDRLDIAIEAQAKGAVKELNSLYSTLGNISNALNRSATGYRNTAREIGRVTASIRSLAAVKIPNLSSLTTQLQTLSKINFKGFSNKDFNLDVKVNIPQTAGQISDMLEQAFNQAKVDTSSITEQIVRDFRIGGDGAKRVQEAVSNILSILSEGFDGSQLVPAKEAYRNAIRDLSVVIKEEGAVSNMEVSHVLEETKDQYRNFYEWAKGQSIYVSDALKGAFDSNKFADAVRVMPTLLVREMGEGVSHIDSLWEEMLHDWPGFFDAALQEPAAQLEAFLNKIKEARDLLQGTTPIRNLTGDNKDIWSDAAKETSKSAAYDMAENLVNAFNQAKETASKELMLDFTVNEDKIVKDIQAAINRAAKVDYDPVKVNLQIDKKHITNTISAELKNMQAGELPTIADAYERLARAIGSLYTASQNTKAIGQMVNAVTRLAKVDMSGFDTGKFSEMTTSIQTLGAMGDVSTGINTLISSLARLANSGANMAATTSTLPAFATAITNAFTTISSGSIEEGAAQAIAAVSRLANAGSRMGEAATNLPALTGAVTDFMTAMSQAPAVSDSTLRMTEALAQMSASGSNVGKAASDASRGMGSLSGSTQEASGALDAFKKALSAAFGGLTSFAQLVLKAQVATVKFGASLVTGFRNIGSSVSGLNKATISLKNLLSVALGFYGIRTLFNWGKEAIQLSSDLTEVQNVVENAFGTEGTKKVEEFVQTSITQFGMAELMAKQVSSRYQAMGVSLGITTGQVAEATKNIASSLNDNAGYDKVADSMGAMSLNLTKLAADMASFYNVEQSEAAEALNAVFTGQTRSLRRFGLDLTQATLQEWALSQGMNANMQTMTQAEKTLLRYQYVMAHTSMIQGDFARTSETWANQLRILKQNFEMLGKTIGNVLVNVFRPLVIWLNNAMSKVIAFAETVGNALGKIFGWTIMHTPAGSTSDALDDMTDSMAGLADGAGDVGSNLGDAAKAAEDLQNSVLGFDELNKLADAATSAGTGGNGSGGGAGSGTSPTSGTAASAADFALVRTDNLFEKYKSDIDTLYELGEYISKTLTNMLNGIDWDKVYMSAKKFGTGLASFLNGLINPELFAALGRTIANSLNTALHFLDSFGTEFNWKNFGKSLGTGVRSFFENFDWKLTAHTFYTFINGFATAFNAAIQEIPFLKIGQNIAEMVRNALGGINWDTVFDGMAYFGYQLASFLNGLIDPSTFSVVGKTVANALHSALLYLNNFGATFDFSEFGNSIAAGINTFFDTFSFDQAARTINTWMIGVLTTAREMIGNLNWKSIGAKIGLALKKIDWAGAFEEAKDLLATALNGFVEFAKGLFDPSGLGTPFTEALDKIVDSAKKFAKQVNWDRLTENIQNLIRALAPAAEGFAAGLATFFSTLADIGAGALNAIGTVFETVFKALDKLPPSVIKEIGENLGTVAGALVTINGLSSVTHVIGGVVGSLLRFGGAAGAAAAGTTAVETATATTTTTFGGFLTALVNSTGFMEGAFISGTISVAEVLQRMGDYAKGGNGVLSELGTLMDEIAKDFAPDLNSEIFKLVNQLEDTGAQGEDAAVALANLFAENNVDPTALETALRRAQGELNMTDGEVNTVERALELLAEQVNVTGESMRMSEQDYSNLSNILQTLTSDGIIPSQLQLDMLQDTLDKSKASGVTAEEAFEAICGELERLGYGTEEAEKLAREKVPGIFEPIETGASGATEKIGNLEVAVSNSTITYDNLRNALSGLSGQYGLTKTDMDVLYSSLAMQENAGRTASDAYSTIVTALDSISGGSTNASNALTNSLASALLGTGDSADTASGKAESFKTGLWNMAAGMGAKAILMAVMGSTYKGMGEKAETAGDKVEGLKGDVGDLAGSVSGYAETARKGGETLGEGIPSGISSGIKSKEFMVDDAITNMTNSAISTSATLLDAHSPSRVFAGMGGDVDEGFANGITNMAGYVLTAIKNMVGPLITEVETFASTMERRGQDAVNSFRSSFENADLSGIVNNMIAGIDWNGLNNSLYNFGYNASMSLANGFRAVRMPSLQYYVSAWDYHDLGNGGWSYTPRLSPWWYARGGFPNMGELFVANEAGPEMVGRMGNKNVVANNLQITEGIKAAVVDGMMQVAMATKSDDSSVPYVINMRVVTDDDETLARRVERGQMRRDSRYNVLAVR